MQRASDEAAGRTLQAWEALQAAMELFLAHDPDGDGGGKRQRVNSSPYTVIVSDTPDGQDGDGGACVHTEDGPVPVSTATRDLLICDGRHVSSDAPDGKGRDGIPEPLRRRVLARDKHRCRRCHGRNSLHEHHVIPRAMGGPTEYWNLLTLCRYCHTLVHADFIVIRGSLKKDLTFVDRQGRPLDGAEVVPAAFYEGLTGGDDTVLRLPEPGEPAARENGTACRAAVPVERLDDLVGQKEVVSDLRLSIDVARDLGEPLGHTLLVGAPGLGKTTIARAVAGELGAPLHATTGPLLQAPADLVAALAGLGPRDVLFIDEIHAMPKPVAELLYKAMDRGGVSAKRHGVPPELVPFTLIGATTEPGTLPDAFLSRFENHEYLLFYEPVELAALINRAAYSHGLWIDRPAAWRLATVARQTPRRALALLKHARKRAVTAGVGLIDSRMAADTLAALGIDELGLEPIDRRYLDVLRAAGGPMPLHRLAQHVGVDVETLRDNGDRPHCRLPAMGSVPIILRHY